MKFIIIYKVIKFIIYAVSWLVPLQHAASRSSKMLVLLKVLFHVCHSSIVWCFQSKKIDQRKVTLIFKKSFVIITCTAGELAAQVSTGCKFIIHQKLINITANEQYFLQASLCCCISSGTHCSCTGLHLMVFPRNQHQ